MAHLTPGLDALGPVDHHRIAGAARELRVPLEHLERGRERHRPARRIVVVGVGRAELVEHLHVLGQVVGVAVEELVLVDRTVRRALTGRTIVGAVEDDGVVELPGLLQVVDDPPDLGIGVLGETGEHLGHPGEQLLLVRVQRIPRPDGVGLRSHVGRQRVDRRQLRALGHDALVDHAAQHPLAVGLVAVVELALVFRRVLLGAVVRRVVRAGAEPHVPGLGRIAGALVAQHPDRLIGKVFRQVIPLFGRIRLIDEPVVLGQVGIPLVGFAAEEAVEPVEALLQRPFRFAAAAGDIFLRHVVVLAHPERAVAVVLQHLTHRRALRGQAGRRTWEAVGPLGDAREPVHVVIAAGQ